MSADDEQKKVGYRNPPRKSRFKPGQSGNPKGRPKHSGNIALEILRELKQPVTVRENGRERVLTKRAALAKAVVSRALAGDPRAFQFLMNTLPDQFRAPEIPQSAEAQTVSAAEAEILERFVARRLGSMSGNQTEPEPPTAQADDLGSTNGGDKNG
jgi:hypothetical protein